MINQRSAGAEEEAAASELRGEQQTIAAWLRAEGQALLALAVLQTGLAAGDARLVEALGRGLARSSARQRGPKRLAIYREVLLSLGPLAVRGPLSPSLTNRWLEDRLGLPDPGKSRAVFEALFKISLAERQILVLCDAAGCRSEEVGPMLCLSAADVRRHLTSARAQVRAACLGVALFPEG